MWNVFFALNVFPVARLEKQQRETVYLQQAYLNKTEKNTYKCTYDLPSFLKANTPKAIDLTLL